jgi:hypothetical protein
MHDSLGLVSDVGSVNTGGRSAGGDPERRGLVDSFDLGGRTFARTVHIEEGMNFADAMKDKPAGTLYIVEGVHREESVIPRHGDAFVGAPGAKMVGARELPASNWRNDGDIHVYKIPDGQRIEKDSVFFNKAAVLDKHSVIAGRPEQLWSTSVSDANKVTPVSRVPDAADEIHDGARVWSLDYDNQEIKARGIDLRSETLELSTQPFAFGYLASADPNDEAYRGEYIPPDIDVDTPLPGRLTAPPDSPADMPDIYNPGDPYFDKPRDVLIANLVIEKYANAAQTGAVGFFRPGLDWTVQNNEIQYNTGVGVKVRGDDAVVSDNIIRYNGHAGVGVGDLNFKQNGNLPEWGSYGGYAGDGVKIINNAINNNLLKEFGFDPEFEGGGSKFMNVFNVQVLDNKWHHNNSNALWLDAAWAGGVVRGNKVSENGGIGIFIELTLGRTYVTENHVYGNSTEQLTVSSSPLAVVTNNTIKALKGATNEAILVETGSEDGTESPRNIDGRPTRTLGAYVGENTITHGANGQTTVQGNEGRLSVPKNGALFTPPIFLDTSVVRFVDNNYADARPESDSWRWARR